MLTQAGLLKKKKKKLPLSTLKGQFYVNFWYLFVWFFFLYLCNVMSNAILMNFKNEMNLIMRKVTLNFLPKKSYIYKNCKKPKRKALYCKFILNWERGILITNKLTKTFTFNETQTFVLGGFFSTFVNNNNIFVHNKKLYYWNLKPWKKL